MVIGAPGNRPGLLHWPARSLCRLGLAALCGLLCSAGSATAEPLTITNGLVLWLKADAGVQTNAVGGVTNWLDQSGWGRNAGLNTNTAPLHVANAVNSLPAARFDGIANRLEWSSVGGLTVFAAVRSDSTAGNLDGLVGKVGADDGIRRAGDTAWRHPGSGDDFSNPAGSTFRVNGDLTTNALEDAWHIIEVVRASSAMSLDSMGGYENGRNFPGDCAELLVYDRVLFTEDRHKVGSYLGDKYAIADSYTSPNPYLSLSAATDITTTSATLNATLYASGQVFAVWAHWGATDGGTNVSDWSYSSYLGTWTNVVSTNITHTATGLSPDTWRYFTFRVTNALADAWAADSGVFKTALIPSALRRRMKITFSGYDRAGTLTNFPALVVFSEALPGFRYGDFAPGGADLRFTDGSGAQEVSSEIERWDPASASYVWVKVSEICGTNTHIWAFWGNPSATSPAAHITSGDVWSENFRGVWHLGEDVEDEAFGGIHYDSTSNNNDAVQNGNCDTTGRIALAQDFDGTNDYADCGVGESLNLNYLTVEAWTKTTMAGVWFRTIVAKYGYSSATASWGLGWMSGSVLGFYVRDSAASNITLRASNGWGLDNNWHHLVGVRGNGQVQLFGDGALLTSTNDSIGDIRNTKPVSIARHSSYSTGTYDEVRISSVALSPDWIWACYMNQASNELFNAYGPVSRQGGTVLTIR